MTFALWTVTVPVSGLVAFAAVRAAGAPRRPAAWAGLVAGLATFVVLAALFVTLFGECLGENREPPPPPSWPWSPRRQLCDESGSAASLGAMALLLFPVIVVVLGAFFRSRHRRVLGGITSATLIAAPVLPYLYVNALPYYRLDSYPVLHRPLLRTAAGSRPPRVCYVYDLVAIEGAPTRHCVDLEPTRQALGLTAGYDEGRTGFDLEQVGTELTRRGLPVRRGPTGVTGLVVQRAYTLPEDEAARGARLID